MKELKKIWVFLILCFAKLAERYSLGIFSIENRYFQTIKLSISICFSLILAIEPWKLIYIFLIKRGKPFAWETKNLARLDGWHACLAGPTFLHNTLVLPAGRFKRDLISDLICRIVVLPFLSNATFFLSSGRELARFVPSWM